MKKINWTPIIIGSIIIALVAGVLSYNYFFTLQQYKGELNNVVAKTQQISNNIRILETNLQATPTLSEEVQKIDDRILHSKWAAVYVWKINHALAKAEKYEIETATIVDVTDDHHIITLSVEFEVRGKYSDVVNIIKDLEKMQAWQQVDTPIIVKDGPKYIVKTTIKLPYIGFNADRFPLTVESK